MCGPNLAKPTKNFNVAIKVFSVWKPHEYYIWCTLEWICEWIFISFKIFSTHFENDLLNTNLFSLFKILFPRQSNGSLYFYRKRKKAIYFSSKRCAVSAHHLKRSWKFLFDSKWNASNLSVVYALPKHARTHPAHTLNEFVIMEKWIRIKWIFPFTFFLRCYSSVSFPARFFMPLDYYLYYFMAVHQIARGKFIRKKESGAQAILCYQMKLIVTRP